MEAIAAFALAGNIIQVVDLGLKAIKICQEVSDTGQINPARSQVVAGLKRTIESLQNELLVAQGKSAQAEDYAMLEVACKCRDTANRLLDELGLVGQSSSNKLILSFKALLKGRVIKELEKELSFYQRTLETQLLLDLRRRHDPSLLRSDPNFDNISSDVQNLVLKLEEGKSEFDQILDEKLDSIYSGVRELQAQVQSLSTNDGNKPPRYGQELINSVLASLFFPEISSREEQIENTYPNTYGWALRSDEDTDSDEYTDSDDNTDSDLGADYHRKAPNLLQWLESGSGLFWLSGHAGSGKSAFMKFITGHQRTDTAIESWASPRKAVRATYFFWSQGCELQRTQRGFLRTILYQVLSTVPELVRFYGIEPNGGIRQWTQERLLQVLTTVLGQSEIPLGLCLFIDGLDESGENPTELLRLLCKLQSMENFKCVVSSRPWPIFQRLLEPYPQIRLQELTDGDIRRFIGGTIRAACDSSLLSKEERSVLIDEMALNAAGVFLWASLATASVIDGLMNGDDYEELLSRIEQLPPGLNETYRAILSRIEDRYREQATRIFRLMLLGRRHDDGEPSVLSLALTDLGIKKDIRPLEDNNIEAVLKDCNHTLIHIQQRCGGLLRVTPRSRRIRDRVSIPISDMEDARYMRVDFIHRTVFDFFREFPETLESTSSGSDEPWDPLEAQALYHIRSMCVFYHPLQSLSTSKDYEINREHLFEALSVIEDIERERGELPGDLLERLETQGEHLLRLIAQHHLPSDIPEYLNWWWLVALERPKVTSLLGLYVMCGLKQPLMSQLPELSKEQCTELLQSALDGLIHPTTFRLVTRRCRLIYSEYFEPRTQLMVTLLEHGADPNDANTCDPQTTAWERFLGLMNNEEILAGRFVDNNYNERAPLYRAKLIAEFLRHGADRRQVVRGLNRNRKAMSEAPSDNWPDFIISFRYEAEPYDIVKDAFREDVLSRNNELMRDDEVAASVLEALRPEDGRSGVRFTSVVFMLFISKRKQLNEFFGIADPVHMADGMSWDVSNGAIDHLATEILEMDGMIALDLGNLGGQTIPRFAAGEVWGVSKVRLDLDRVTSGDVTAFPLPPPLEILREVVLILDTLPPLTTTETMGRPYRRKELRML